MDLFENLSEVQMEAVKTTDEDLEIIACAGAVKLVWSQEESSIFLLLNPKYYRRIL